MKDLKVTVLKEGSGSVVKEDSTITANYFGWTSDGSIFDSTNKNGKVTPIDFSLTGVIQGWTKGLTGQKLAQQSNLQYLQTRRTEVLMMVRAGLSVH